MDAFVTKKRCVAFTFVDLWTVTSTGEKAMSWEQSILMFEANLLNYFLRLTSC